MSGVALVIRVGGTRMTVDMADHFAAANDGPRTLSAMVTCMHCGALTVDYEIHLVWHIQRGELSLQTEQVMPQDIDGDEVDAPEMQVKPCPRCGHRHQHHQICGEPLPVGPHTACRCTAVYSRATGIALD